MRKSAAEALENLNWQPKKNKIGAIFWIIKQRWDKCLEIGEPTIAPLTDTLRKSNDSSIRSKIVDTLGKLKSAQTLQPLTVALRDTDASIRQKAVKALEQLGDLRVIDHLIVALKDNDKLVRSSAAEALGKLNNEHAIGPLIDAINSRDELVRKNAAEALEQFGEDAVKPLIIALHDPSKSEDFRFWAARTLGKLGDVRAVEILLPFLKHPKEQVQARAIEALRRFDGLAKEELIADLKNEDVKVSLGIAKALGELDNSEVVKSLLNNLKSDQEDIRLGAIQALGQTWQLLELIKLGNKDWRTRSIAAEELGKLGDPRAGEPLIATLRDSSRMVQQKAFEALKRLGGSVLNPLIVVLTDKDEDVRYWTVQALGELRDIGVVEPLTNLGRDENEYVRLVTVEALEKLGIHFKNAAPCTQIVASLTTYLDDSNRDVRKVAVRALRSIETPDALAALQG